MFTNKKRRRIKPFARPTSFDFNAVFDLRHMQQQKYGSAKAERELLFPQTCNTDEGYQVMEGEVLMQMNQGAQVRRYGDHQMHCFGFANGLKKEMANPRGFFVCERYEALAQLKYAGVAVTGFKPEVDIFEQGFVVTVAGLNTIFNNGDSDIHPGDLICASVPPPRTGFPGRGGGRAARAAGRAQNRANAQGGIPHSKIGFTVTPHRTLVGELQNETLYEGGARVLSDAQKSGIHELASRFIMGTAMSYAKPGYPVDVVLHRCNIISVRRAADEDELDELDDSDFYNSGRPSAPPEEKSEDRGSRSRSGRGADGRDRRSPSRGGGGSRRSPRDSTFAAPKAPDANVSMTSNAPAEKITKAKKKSSKKDATK